MEKSKIPVPFGRQKKYYEKNKESFKNREKCDTPKHYPPTRTVSAEH